MTSLCIPGENIASVTVKIFCSHRRGSFALPESFPRFTPLSFPVEIGVFGISWKTGHSVLADFKAVRACACSGFFKGGKRLGVEGKEVEGEGVEGEGVEGEGVEGEGVEGEGVEGRARSTEESKERESRREIKEKIVKRTRKVSQYCELGFVIKRVLAWRLAPTRLLRYVSVRTETSAAQSGGR